MANNEKLPLLPGVERTILKLLVGGSEMFGLELIEASGGQLKRGTIYVTLQRMSEKGLVESREEPRPSPEIGIARRKYSITGFGSRVLRAYDAAMTTFASEAFR